MSAVDRRAPVLPGRPLPSSPGLHRPLGLRGDAVEAPGIERLLYAGAAAFLLVLMFLGFQQFYLHGRAYPDRDLAPPIRTLIILHGCAMTAWMLLFLVQPLLIVSGRRRAHARLGRAGAILAAGIVVLGLRVAVEAARIKPPDLRIFGFTPTQFLLIPIASILLFAGFVVAGVWYRRRPEVHRPLMLLSVLAVMPAAVNRIAAIENLYHGTVWATLFGPFFSTLVIGAAFLVLARLLTRMWDRWYAAGYAGLAVAWVATVHLATTSAWEHLARALVR